MQDRERDAVGGAAPCRPKPHAQAHTTVPRRDLFVTASLNAHAARLPWRLPPSFRTHPNDRGHQVIAELLAGLVLKAADRVRAGGAPGWSVGWAAERDAKLPPTALPEPMVPGNDDAPSTLCAMQASAALRMLPHGGCCAVLCCATLRPPCRAGLRSAGQHWQAACVPRRRAAPLSTTSLLAERCCLGAAAAQRMPAALLGFGCLAGL